MDLRQANPQQCSSNVVQRAREISGKHYESAGWKSVGSATGNLFDASDFCQQYWQNERL
jgi:cell wall-associated NlpC family hydrolase